MGVPTSEVGYTPAMPRREDHEVHEGYMVELGGGGLKLTHFRPGLYILMQKAVTMHTVYLESSWESNK